MNRYKYLSVAALSLLLLASCGSSGIGDVLGTGSNQNAQLRGTVDSVDLNSHSIYLINVSNYNNSMLSNSGNAVRVYYDNNTRVQYQGRAYRPEDLERGDQVDVNAQQSGNQLAANTITVVSDVRTSGTYPGTNPNNTYPTYPGNTYPNNGTYGSTLHGTVTYVDTSRQTIQIDTGYNNVVTLGYNSSTPVYWNGQTYRAADLQRGDEIDVRTSGSGNGMMAQDITVTRNVSNGSYGTSSGTYPSSTQTSTIRGTVQYVDTANRTIQVSSTTWIAGFNPGTRTSTGTILVHYDPSTQVNVRGSMYPISGLERGDIVEISVQNLGGSNVLAQQIWLVQDVNNRM